MATDTNPTVDPYGNFYFSLLIDDVEIARFMECSGLKTSSEVYEIEEGGLNTHSHKRPGHSTWDDVTLKKGVHAGSSFEAWRDEYMREPDYEAQEDEGWKRRRATTAAIVVRDSDGAELRRYTLLQCWPLSWEGPSLNADGSALAVETLELAHEGILVDDSPRPQGPQGGRVNAEEDGDDTDDMVAHFVIAGLGVTITQAKSMGLKAMIVEDHVAMMDILRCSFHAEGDFDWSSVSLGGEVEAGFGGHDEMVFKGLVTATRHYMPESGEEMLEVIAMDPLCKLGASRHTRIFEEVKDSDIVNTVLGEAGVDKGTIDSTSTTYKYVLQRNESDLDFLKRLAARNGYMLNGTYEGKIEFVKPQYSGSPLELKRKELMAFDYTVSPQEIPPEMTVYGWDYVAKEIVSGTATDGDIEGIGGGANGVAESGTIWQQPAYISDVLVTDQAAAKDMAIAELNRHARTFLRGRAVVKGTGAIRAGALVTFKDFATGFNPEVFVVGSRHMVSQALYTTEFWFIGNTLPQ